MHHVALALKQSRTERTKVQSASFAFFFVRFLLGQLLTGQVEMDGSAEPAHSPRLQNATERSICSSGAIVPPMSGAFFWFGMAAGA